MSRQDTARRANRGHGKHTEGTEQRCNPTPQERIGTHDTRGTLARGIEEPEFADGAPRSNANEHHAEWNPKAQAALPHHQQCSATETHGSREGRPRALAFLCTGSWNLGGFLFANLR